MANIVITMAGRGSRFLAAGYREPKYAIQVHGRSLFEWSMLSLSNLIQPDDRLIFICLGANRSSEFVRRTCERLGYEDVVVHELDELTDGQATSAYESRMHWRMEEPLLIYNIDTYVQPDHLLPEHIRAGSDGWIPCFRVPGDHWSFVRLGDHGWAVEVAEKRRISDCASIGLYWFGTARIYDQAYQRFFAKGEALVNGEKYVAPLYGDLIAQGLRVSVSDIPPGAVHVLGTPEELESFAGREPGGLG